MITAGITASRILLVVGMACAARAAAEGPSLGGEDAAFRAAVERVAGAVVRIEPVVAAPAGEAAAGPSTGLVVDASGLVLATEFAVPVGTRETVVVPADGRRVVARPLGRDAIRGVVLLRTDPLPGAPAVEAVPRASLEPGQWTIAVGRGWSAAEPNVSVGIVSAVDRGWGLVVQTDASVSPQNYGGPLVDIAGRVIGILAPLPAEPARLIRGTDLYDSGIGFAVPLEDVLANLPRLRDGESLEPGILGVGYAAADPLNAPPEIISVRQGSPAARAGLRPGDRIVGVDGRAVRRIADVRHAVVPRRAGETITIAVDRGVGAETTRATVQAELVAALPPWRRAILGIVAGDDARGDAGAGRDGVPIDWVLPGGPAEAAGVAAGCRVTAVESVEAGPASRVPTSDRSTLAGVLAGYEPGQQVRLAVDRGGVSGTCDVRLAEMIRDVPDEGPAAAAAAPATGDAVRVARLKAADLSDPPLAVLPPGRDPVPLLVWCDEPRGRVDDDAAAVWKAAAVAAGVAVILPGSSAAREWSGGDVPTVVRSLQAAAGERAIDASRIAVAGRGAGGGFAWLVADALGDACRGVAVIDATLPARVGIDEAEPGRARWILLGRAAVGLRPDDDRARLERAGHAVGNVDVGGAAPPAATLCRWAALLGLL